MRLEEGNSLLFKVSGPARAEATRIRNSKPTAFRKFYERGDFPIALEHDTKGNKIAWKVRNSTQMRFGLERSVLM